MVSQALDFDTSFEGILGLGVPNLTAHIKSEMPGLGAESTAKHASQACVAHLSGRRRLATLLAVLHGGRRWRARSRRGAAREAAEERRCGALGAAVAR